MRVKVTNKDNSHPALFVTFESTEIAGFFSDNVFMLLAGESKEVVFTAKYRQINLYMVMMFTLQVKSYNMMLELV